jgi:glycosyltransferase involved in cell wall biosynthesis
MKIKQKLVTIILNCYNGEKFLKEALSSIKKQTYKNWELIFWDNRSVDNSYKILKSFKNKKFKYFLSHKHTSLYEARNLAIRKASGEFISFIDADDTWEKDKLKKQISFFRDTNVSVVYGNSWLKNEKNKKRKKFINYKVRSGYIYKDLIKKYNVGILTSLIKSKVLQESKILFNKKYNIIGDFDFFIRLSKKYQFQYISEPIATYRIHKGNLSSLKKDLQIKEFFFWLKLNKKKLHKQDYKIIKNKIRQLQFIDKKLSKNFVEYLSYFIKFNKELFNLKNTIILLTPKTFLRKLMWFS